MDIRQKGKKDFLSPEEEKWDKALRPLSFDDFMGQEGMLSNLKVFVAAANLRKEPLDHVLLHGPPGLGKTTLAAIIAQELGVVLKATSAPVIEKAGDLAGLLTSLSPRDVLFIDEIHRLSPVVEEYLYSAMEDYRIDILVESGPNARSIPISLAPFTLVGATTRSGLLTAPMRDRFGITCRLNYYMPEFLEKIVLRSARLLKTEVAREIAYEIAQRSRGTPRIANNLLRRVRDFSQTKGDKAISLKVTIDALDALQIDKNGLDEMDILILKTLAYKFDGGPVGLGTIATAVSENAETIEEVYEPFLIQQGLLKRTPRGRELSMEGRSYLGLPEKKDKSPMPNLFDL